MYMMTILPGRNMDVGNSKYKIDIRDYGNAIDLNLTKALTVFCKGWFALTS